MAISNCAARDAGIGPEWIIKIRGKKSSRHRIQSLNETNSSPFQPKEINMPRIQTINAAAASTEQQQLLATVKQMLGGVPNLIATLAQSPAAVTACLTFSGALAKGSLSAKLREQISLVVGETNSCDYCVAAHTMLSAKAGLSKEEVPAAPKLAACGCAH